MDRLATKKAPGPDGIPNEILRETSDLLQPHLCLIINTSLFYGHYPHYFRQSITVALRKPQKGDYTIPKN